MAYADQQGLQRVVRQIQEFTLGRNGWSWTPAPLLTNLVVRRATFGSLG